jgi:hypothetical protein
MEYGISLARQNKGEEHKLWAVTEVKQNRRVISFFIAFYVICLPLMSFLIYEV